MTAFLEWLDLRPALYWTFAWGSFALTGLACWLPSLPPAGARWRRAPAHPVVFAALVSLTLAAFRWPSWFVPGELNPDESQIIAGAITLREYPVFWKFVDGTTHGPLNEYLLTAASWAGLPLTFPGARIMAVLVIAGALLSTWGALRRLLPEPLARLGILPALGFWSFSWKGDFLHFSSELVALLLVAMATWGGVTALTTERPRRWVWGSVGAVLALVPLAKLQATPLALILGLGGLALLAWQRAPGWRGNLLSLSVGALVVALALGAYLAIYGLQAQFWYSYIVSNLGYAESGHHPLAEMPNFFFGFMTTGQSFAWFFYGCLSFTLLYARGTWQEAAPRLHVALLAGWAMVGFAYYCVLAPGREVAHYLQLLVLPITFLAALQLPARRAEPGARWSVPVILFVILAVAPQGLNRLQAVQEQLGRFGEFKASPNSAAGNFIRERQQAGQLLAVWGWNAQLHVETQLPQGTREAHSAFQIMHGPLREFYRSRYVRDMRQRQPEWFVDAVGPRRFAFEYRDVDGHETFPDLDRIIRDHYELLTEIDSMRIYRRAR
jgi:hypothetical protein